MATATFRFYAELNDFLPPARRQREFVRDCAQDASVKHAIEAMGVPHTEVELVLVNGSSVDFSCRLRDGDRVAVYPVFEAFDVRGLPRPRPDPMRNTLFFADAHLGGLARLLRLAGFDTLYDNHIADPDLVEIALREGRIVLTRDVDLLKRREITHGCYIHALKPVAQLQELFERLQLAGSVRPFTLCLDCNAPLRPAPAEAVRERVPPRVRETHTRFATCDVCHRIYWEGSHWRRMRALLDGIVRPGAT